MKKYKELFKVLFAFLLYFSFNAFFSNILKLFNINIKELSNLKINILLLLCDLIIMVILFLIYRREVINDLKKFGSNKGRWFIKYIGIFLISVLVMGILNIILSKVTHQEISNNEDLVRKMIKSLPIYMTFSTVMYAPFIEELLFRKGIRKIINGNDRYTKIAYIIISATIFGLLHVITLDASFNDLLMGIPYMVVGLSLAYIYIKTDDNLFGSMQFHLMHNLILLILQLMMRG
jgi:membrane protease YdiL (CAAX protease family)